MPWIDETKYPNGPRLCCSLGLDARIPTGGEHAASPAPSSNVQSNVQKEIYGDRIPFYQRGEEAGGGAGGEHPVTQRLAFYPALPYH